MFLLSHYSFKKVREIKERGRLCIFLKQTNTCTEISQTRKLCPLILALILHMLMLLIILPKDESTRSTVSSDSCEYYETEIYDLLPSVQACRLEQSRYGPSEGSEDGSLGPESTEGESNGYRARGPRDKASVPPLRNLPVCMQGKRGIRWASVINSFW